MKFQSEAKVSSQKAQRYLAQLCKHFAHKIPVEWDQSGGQARFDMGICIMSVGDNILTLTCSSETRKGLDCVKSIVEDHMIRFGWQENLKLEWSGSSADKTD